MDDRSHAPGLRARRSARPRARRATTAIRAASSRTRRAGHPLQPWRSAPAAGRGDAAVADGRQGRHDPASAVSGSREARRGGRRRVCRSRGDDRGFPGRAQGTHRRRAVRAGDHQRHAARKLVDGQEPGGDAFALLVKDGTYTLEQPAPVPLWRAPGDPRGAIRQHRPPAHERGAQVSRQPGAWRRTQTYPDHYYIYTGGIDAFDYSITRPQEYPPNTDGRYRNSDPLTITYLTKLAVTKRGENFLTWPQRALFDRIGIRRQVLETDPYGNFLITRLRLRHGAELGAPRAPLSAGRHLAGRADPAGRLGDVREHAGAGVEAPRVRRVLLAQSR